MQWCMNQAGINMSKGNNNNCTVTEKECEWCGDSFTFTGLRSDYVFKRTYKGRIKYFCCESCMRKYQEARKNLIDNRRALRRARKAK